MYDENGEPFGFSFGGNDYYYVRNAQNDVYLIVDSNNQAVVVYQYDAWGNITHCYDISTNDIVSALNPYTYRCYFRDNETGLYYLKSRYYFPEFHRFICADNAISSVGGSILGYNQFVYCFNNPTNLNDSSGNWPERLTKCVEKVKSICNNVVKRVKSACKKVVNLVKPRGSVRYNVPLYAQGNHNLCWAYSQIMIESYNNGSSLTQSQADERVEELSRSINGEDWDVEGTPTNLGSKIKTDNIYSLYYYVATEGPLYCRYANNNNDGHLVVVTGVDIWNKIVYTNNPHGISGSQSFEEFTTGFTGMGEGFMTFDSVFTVM